jgi:hypothetical protein
MTIFSKSRKVVCFVIIASIIVAAQLPAVREDFIARIHRAYDPTTGAVGANVAGRIDTWKRYLSSAGPREYILGQGFKRGLARNEMESHSVYIALLTVYGIGGVIWGATALIYFFKRVVYLITYSPEPLFSVVGGGCMWALMAWGIYGLAADAIDATYGIYILFYLVVLVDRAYCIALETSQQMHLEETYDDVHFDLYEPVASEEYCFYE